MKLQNKVALITGGTTGIGLATAELFQKEGAQVIVTGKNPVNLRAAQEKLGPKALVIEADAASIADSEKVAKEIETRFGGLDIAFLNAGIAQFGPIESTTEAFYDHLFGVNVKGLFFQTLKVMPLLRGNASVIFNSSVVNQRGWAMTSVYSATKAAVRSFARTFAAELVGKGIRVNVISPGPITTPIYEKLGSETQKAFEENLKATNPMKRFGSPDEVAKTALYFASDDSSYVTGAEITVDGGLTQL